MHPTSFIALFEFTHIVNNKNTKKSLEVLSNLYFGNHNYCKMLKRLNDLDVSKTTLLKGGIELSIPNY